MISMFRRSASTTDPHTESTMADRPTEEGVKDKWSLSEYLERTWGQLEKGVEDAVQRSLGVLKIPRRETLQEFASRLDAIEKRISALEGKGG